jgi:hypothetical protein
MARWRFIGLSLIRGRMILREVVSSFLRYLSLMNKCTSNNYQQPGRISSDALSTDELRA